MRLFSDIGTSVSDPHMRRALALAQQGAGSTSPNPMVGCVVVRDGSVVGEGFHQYAGGPHAEVIALRAAGEAARGATVYVTLEPCSHHGKTPPCTDALLRAGVAEVIIGMPDPTSIAGGGAGRLLDAGVDVSYTPDDAPFRELNEAWLHVVGTGWPYVHVKVALSLDGHLTGSPGVRSAVSGPGGSEVTMRVRAQADAVLVGAATARVDEPSLTLRDPDGAPLARQPLRVVLGTRSVPDTSLFHDGLGDAVALIPRDAEVPDGVAAVRYDIEGGICAALEALGREKGVSRVLVETGSRLFTSLMEQDLIDELTVVHAGGVFGPSAPALFLGRVPGDAAVLDRSMRAVEAGVIQGDAVSVWRSVKAY